MRCAKPSSILGTVRSNAPEEMEASGPFLRSRGLERLAAAAGFDPKLVRRYADAALSGMLPKLPFM